ncbi:MAG: YtxH domain-containing protein [Anaerolineales bacterium]|nr:YtxH domain-containing protein [Anaerolineales bacterium]
MEDNLEQHASDGSNSRNVVLGLLIGGLAGAATMLIFAPQSGRRTRSQIRLKSSQLRDQTSDVIDNAIEQVRSETQNVKAGVQEKAGQMKQRGLDKLVEQMDHVSGVLDTGKSAIKDA